VHVHRGLVECPGCRQWVGEVPEDHLPAALDPEAALPIAQALVPAHAPEATRGAREGRTPPVGGALATLRKGGGGGARGLRVFARGILLYVALLAPLAVRMICSISGVGGCACSWGKLSRTSCLQRERGRRRQELRGTAMKGLERVAAWQANPLTHIYGLYSAFGPQRA
jgi:hypothetical protein